MRQAPGIPIIDRLRLIGYGCIAGLVVGIFLGWIFHGFVGFLVKISLLIVLMVPLVLAIYFWRRVTTPTVSAPRSDIRDADWIELESGNRRQR